MNLNLEKGIQRYGTTQNAKEVKQVVEGTIVQVRTMGGLDTYILDTGEQWSDSAGRHKKGDRVRVSPYIMGTVRVEKL
jgi:hypothetical protein